MRALTDLPTQAQESTLEEVFPGSTTMARRMRALDWERTSLGPVSEWPQSLRTSVSICLNCAFPIVLWWGPELALLYNDEYSQFIGPAKGPWALGEPGAKVWAEIWDVIAPMLSHVVTSGEPTRSRDLLLHIDRVGYPEEAYFSFSYSPIYAEHGKVGGIFCPVIETTEKVIGERRLRTLRDLAARCKGAESEASAYTSAAAVMAENAHDIPFSMIYAMDEDGSTARLRATAGIERGPAAPETISLDVLDAGTWSLAAVAHSGKAVVLSDLATRYDQLPSGAWKTPPHSAVVTPILLPGQERPRAILVTAVSPMRALDEQYLAFFGLIPPQIASSVADALALQEERRRAEALAEIDRAKTAFFSNVSHEFRTPLTLMLGPLEDTLANAHGVLPPAAAESLSVAHRNSMRLLRLVNTLLDFSRIEAGRVDANYEAIDLATLTIELASVFRSAVEKAGLRLVVDCATIPEPVFVDRDMWEKIVLNLLSNAFKFTFEGEVAVSLRHSDDAVELSVRDTGVGIPAADVPRMFERFHRVKHTRARTHEGTGIGLALVRELARLHGGDVTVDSLEGHGTTFTVRIPRGSSHLPADRIGTNRRLTSTSVGAAPFVEEALRWLPTTNGSSHQGSMHGDGLGSPSQGAIVSTTRARVLVADDNADMREYLCSLLAPNYEIVAVADGQEALDAIVASAPDLVLTDMMMPRLDGAGLVAALRREERTRTLPVIMLSARAGEEARIEGLATGADDYLIKPFSARELLARVHSQLELARMRREAETALRYRTEQIESLLRAAPVGVYMVDADFRIAHMNPVAAPLFGDVPGGVIGRDLAEVFGLIVDESRVDELMRIFRHTLDTGESYVAAERAGIRPKGDRTQYFEWRLDRITQPDGRFGLVCYFRDISAQVHERKALEDSREALRAADRSKDEFLAMLAHELRNPLAPIRNSLHVLRLASSPGDTGATTRVREMMERQVNHMVRLVDDLMEVSRITRGKIELRKEESDLATMVRTAVETSKPLIEAARHELSVVIPNAPLLLEADPVRITQVISNLLNNAAKYTPDGGQIWLTARAEGAEIVVAVRDSGVGIPTEALPKVFDLFMQGERTYDRAQGGLGIGLTLVRSLVQMHGGSVEAKSEGPGRGAEFVVRLPMARRRSTPAGMRSLTGPPGLHGHRILVVDDNRDGAASLGILLKLLGADVHAVNDGPTALEAVRMYKPSVVLLDIGLPGMDGYELARRLRQEPADGDLTLVALSGWGQEEDRRRSKAAGIDHHLVKPIDIPTLEQLLANLPSSANPS